MGGKTIRTKCTGSFTKEYASVELEELTNPHRENQVQIMEIGK
jgi:hypothetical protein